MMAKNRAYPTRAQLAGASPVMSIPYNKGFYDAQDSAPIWFQECSAEYAAGWMAYWEIRAGND